MEILQAERRATANPPTGPAAGDPAELVRQAMLLQACIGTRSAVEYLKSHRLDGRVINRVLSGGNVREGDRAAPRGLPRLPE